MGQKVKELRADVPQKVLEPPWPKGFVTRKGAPYERRAYTPTIMFNFEKLEVWSEAIASADNIYRITKAFPGGERFGLTDPMRPAASQSPPMSPRAVPQEEADGMSGPPSDVCGLVFGRQLI